MTPSGEVLAVDDLSLIARLSEGLEGTHALSLLRSDRSFTDCRPVSVFSLQTVQQIGEEVGFTLDKRRFRANVYADLTPMIGSPRTGLSVAGFRSAPRRLSLSSTEILGAK